MNGCFKRLVDVLKVVEKNGADDDIREGEIELALYHRNIR
jgi:hypothetical protein